MSGHDEDTEFTGCGVVAAVIIGWIIIIGFVCFWRWMR